MSPTNDKPPVVLVLAGHDPCGGAGIQADIETLASVGCHACPIITAMTAQNTQQCVAIYASNSSGFAKQLELILDDMQPTSCKIGMISDLDIMVQIRRMLSDHRDMTVVYDPVLGASAGYDFANEEIINGILQLLPSITLLTPTAREAFRLSGLNEANTDIHADLVDATLDAAANRLLDRGCQHVLITGGDAATPNVINRLYTPGSNAVIFSQPRLRGQYHGSGCTLSSAITGFLANRFDLADAVRHGLAYTWQTLNHAHHLGKQHSIPDRTFWGRYDPQGDH